MVNYQYRLADIEVNHEAYRGEGRVRGLERRAQPVARELNAPNDGWMAFVGADASFADVQAAHGAFLGCRRSLC